MARPLEGLRVVELGTHIAVPLGSRMMAEWGAEVIKVEAPEGDAYRSMGLLMALPFKEDFNVLLQPTNAGKKDICINLKDPEGLKVLFKLLETADIFTTSIRLSALKKMGLDYDSIKEQYPGLVYAHFSGFGNKGAESERPGFDTAAFWARGGEMIEWSNEGVYPVRPFLGFGDAVSSSMLLNGILGALIKKEKTGVGDYVESSLLATSLWYNFHGVIMGQPQFGHKFPRKHEQPLGGPMQVHYETKDGDWMLIVEPLWDWKYKKYLEFLDLEVYMEDPRFTSFRGAAIHVAELIPIFADAFQKKTTAEVKEFLIKNDIVHERLVNPSELCEDQQAWDNGYLREVEFQNGKKMVMPKEAIHFASMDEPAYTLAPDLGQHSLEILLAAGYSQEEAEKLIAAKAVIQHP